MHIKKLLLSFVLITLLVVCLVPIAFAEDPTFTVAVNGDDIQVTVANPPTTFAFYFNDKLFCTPSGTTSSFVFSKSQFKEYGLNDEVHYLCAKYTTNNTTIDKQICGIKLRDKTDSAPAGIQFYLYNLDGDSTNHIVKNVPAGCEYNDYSSNSNGSAGWHDLNEGTTKLSLPDKNIRVRYKSTTVDGEVPVYTLASDFWSQNSASAEEYDVWVNSEQFTSTYGTINCGENGTAKYYPDTSTIVLDNASITRAIEATYGSTSVYAGIHSSSAITITGNSAEISLPKLEGKNVAGIFVRGENLNIGDIKLTINNNNNNNGTTNFYGIIANDVVISNSPDNPVAITSNGIETTAKGIICSNLTMSKTDDKKSTVAVNIPSYSVESTTIDEGKYTGIEIANTLTNNGGLLNVSIGKSPSSNTKAIALCFGGSSMVAYDGKITLKRDVSTNLSDILFCNEDGTILKTSDGCHVSYKTSDGDTKDIDYDNSTWPEGMFVQNDAVEFYIEGGVTIPAKSIVLNSGAESITIAPEGTATLTAVVHPQNADYTAIAWESSNLDVVTVSDGTVTGVAEGEATITATVSNGTENGTNAVSDTIKVVVAKDPVDPTDITIELSQGKSSTIDLDSTDKTLPLIATVTPTGATTTITWTSSDTSVAEINSSTGVVTGKATGSTAITATATTSKGSITSKPLIVYVVKSSLVPTAITIDGGGKTEIDLNSSTKTLQLTAKLTPTGSTSTVTWKSSNEAVATVAPSNADTFTAVVTGLAVGDATISATTANGLTYMYTIKVTNTVPVDGIVITQNGTTVTDDIPISVGETTTLYAKVSPDDATDKDVTWASSSGNVQITPNGNYCTVKGLTAASNIAVTATSKSDTTKSSTVTFTVGSTTPVLTKATGDATFTSLSGTKTLGVTISPSYMAQYIVWECADKTGICTFNQITTDKTKAAVQPLAVGETTVRAYVYFNGARVGNYIDFKVTVSNASYAVTYPTVNNSLIWYYDSSYKSGTYIQTNIPSSLITKVTIGEVSIPIGSSSCTVSSITGGSQIDVSYSWLKNTLQNKDSKYYFKVYYGTGTNDYVWKYIYVRSVKSSPITGDSDMSNYVVALTGSFTMMTMLACGYLVKGKKQRKK